MSGCGCKCHSGGPQATCDVEHDKVSSGVAGLPSCSPCFGASDKVKGSCEHCGHAYGTGHEWVEGDCVLSHKGHSRKLVEGAQVCQHCVDRHVDWLGEIVDLYATLHEVLYTDDMQPEQMEYQKPRKRPASPSPIRLDTWSLLHPSQLNSHVQLEDGTMQQATLGQNLPDIPDLLHNWAQACFDAKGFTDTAPDTVTGAAAFLKANADTMAGIPDVDTYDDELRWIRRSLRNAHGISNPQPIGKCMSVDCDGMVWRGNGAQPKCDRCKRAYGRLDLVRLQITEEGRVAS